VTLYLLENRLGSPRETALCVAFVGIPVKVNVDSGGKPNGVPERR
jgi:hypothetical protein